MNNQNMPADWIHTDADKCVGCNRCIRVCPVETANIAYQEADKSIKVRLDSSQCILCGACVEVCEHSARTINDDTERFFRDLAQGQTISVIAAPSIRTNLPHWQKFFTWLRQLGVQFIYDVSLGADICVWAHLRLLEDRRRPLITQPCPVVVSYCERHRHELLPFLSPIHSPMACTAIYMRHTAGIQGKIASISPCLAKKQEHQSTDLIAYNITFQQLYRYMEEHNIRLPEEEDGFDHPAAGPGTLFPLPGGLTENLELFAANTLHIEKAEGNTAFKYLDQYAQTEPDFLPDVFDVLHCTAGCLIGSGSQKKQNIFALGKQMQSVRSQAVQHIERSRARLLEYDHCLRLEDYLRTYTAFPQKYTDVSEEEIDQVFLTMNKDTFAKRHFNCGACGSDSCHSMARKIALQVNIPMNCVIASRDEAKQERERNAEYLALVQNIGDNLFSTQDEEYAAQVQNSLRVVSETIHCSAVAIWSNGQRVNGWYGDDPASIAIYGEWPEDWLAQLKQGRRVLVNAKKDKPGLFPDAVTTLFIVPIHIRGEFWGFVDAISMEDRDFSEEEASLVEAAGILLISGILEREVNRNLILAKEDALAGTRAKSDFLSRMSHEIRTPMNAIIGMTRMGITAKDLPRKDYCLERIGNASNHLLGVINDILDMSKIEADKFKLSQVWFDFEKMLQSVAHVIAFRIEEKKQAFTVDIDPRIPATLYGDDQRLAQVITNLLSNAIKFTPDSGRIKLTAIFAGPHTVRIEVTDTGIGIETEDQERLFQSFEQAENGTSRKFGGTGLGLAISKRIVEMMGGTIEVASTPGAGSTFFFTFETRGGQDTKNTPQLPQKAMRILAVDKDLDTRTFFSRIARQWGMACDTACNRAEMFILLEKKDVYDICFVDYNLLNAIGASLVEKIRARQEKEPRIVLLSGINGPGIKNADIGIDQFLTKPLFPSSVLACIREDEKSSAEISALQDEEEACFDGYRVLVAEDIEINREIFAAMLEPSALEIDFAANGQIALEKFEVSPHIYHLIFMDIQMPEMDGYEATTAIRKLHFPYAKEIPIIAMTANVFKEDIDRCFASGMDDHVGKPLDYEILIEKLRRYLTR